MKAATIQEYNSSQSKINKEICKKLKEIIDTTLKKSTSKIWHGGPVWFIDGNPIVGYWVRKTGEVSLLFWSGQSFKEEGLNPEGKYKAAEISYSELKDVKVTKLKKLLKESIKVQWNYKDIVKNKGKLSML
jgi:hypothetical protein